MLVLETERQSGGSSPIMLSRVGEQRPEPVAWPVWRSLLHCAYITAVMIMESLIFTLKKTFLS